MRSTVHPYFTWWLASARHWSQIAAFAPLVVQRRLSDIAAAGKTPSAATLVEMTRMTTEKGEALAESGVALWMAAVHAQQLAWQRAWRAGRPAPALQDFALAASTARKLGRTLRPVSSRVGANAKRLTAKRRRRS